MSTELGYGGTSGYLRIGRITSINADKFRCDLEFPGSYSVAKDVSLSPSPLLGFVPVVGSYVTVYDRPGSGKRIIGLLDTPDDRSFDEVMAQESRRGTIPRCEAGDVYIGGAGRAFFGSTGDVRISSKGRRAGLTLKSEKARAELNAYNFDLSTPGTSVRIRTKSTTPLTWGDSLYLEVNTPIAPGIDSAPEVLPTTLGRININNLGSVKIDVLPLSGTLNSSLSMDVSGLIELGRGFPQKSVGLTLGMLDGATLFNTYGRLSISGTELGAPGEVELDSYPGKSKLNLSPVGNVLLTNALGSLNIEPTGQVNISSAGGNLEVREDGSFGVHPNSLTYGLGINAAGDLAFGGKSVDISATTTATLTGAVSASIQGALINLGAVPVGHVAIAEALADVFRQLDILHQAIKLHTHIVTNAVPAAGGVPVMATISPQLQSAQLVPPPPSAAFLGSKTVSVQA